MQRVAQAGRGRQARIILELDVAGLVAGTALRGSLDRRSLAFAVAAGALSALSVSASLERSCIGTGGGGGGGAAA